MYFLAFICPRFGNIQNFYTVLFFVQNRLKNIQLVKNNHENLVCRIRRIGDPYGWCGRGSQPLACPAPIPICVFVIFSTSNLHVLQVICLIHLYGISIEAYISQCDIENYHYDIFQLNVSIHEELRTLNK